MKLILSVHLLVGSGMAFRFPGLCVASVFTHLGMTPVHVNRVSWTDPPGSSGILGFSLSSLGQHLGSWGVLAIIERDSHN